MEELLVIPTLILIFFLPGFAVVQALFPGKNEVDAWDDWTIRLMLACTLSLILTGVIYVLLAMAPGKPLTAANMFLSLLGFSGLFFLIGYHRGGYPFLGGPEAPGVPPPPMLKEDLPVHRELVLKVCGLDKAIAKASKRYDSEPTKVHGARFRNLKGERDRLNKAIWLLEKPPEVREVHEKARALTRKWERLNRAEPSAVRFRKTVIQSQLRKTEDALQLMYDTINAIDGEARDYDIRARKEMTYAEVVELADTDVVEAEDEHEGPPALRPPPPPPPPTGVTISVADDEER